MKRQMKRRVKSSSKSQCLGPRPPVAVMPGKPEDREDRVDREDREDRGRGGAKKRRLFPNDDASL